MTIASRLFVLVTVPLAALVGLGVFTGLQLTKIEQRSRFVSESRIAALATGSPASRAPRCAIPRRSGCAARSS